MTITMAITGRQEVRVALGFSRNCGSRTLGIAVAMCCVLATGTALAGGNGRFCSATAEAQFDACKKEVKDDFFPARAICINVSDREERKACFAAAQAQHTEGRQRCGEQLVARGDLCAVLGEDRYEPDFDSAHFDDDFRNLTSPNPYFPLGIGNQWKYVGGDETITITVLDKTKLIEGVTCIVVKDQVKMDGQLAEDTDDWFGQRKDGTVDYCGESTRSLETFKGDDPAEPELVDIEGSWKAGREGDRSGTLFLGSPTVGAVYRQEFSAGDAEDASRVLSTTYGFGADPQLDPFVPQSLAALLCAAHDCVVTGEFSPLSPGGFERKYYARGIGLFLEVKPRSGSTVQLVTCNVDPRCTTLPAPTGRSQAAALPDDPGSHASQE